MKLKKIGLLVLCVVAMSSAVHAKDLRQNLLSCATYGNDVVRLSCYDALARDQLTVNKSASATITGAAAETAVPSKQEQVGMWNVVQADKLVSFTTKDTPLTSGDVGIAKLIISCPTDKQASLAIDWGFDLGRDVYLALSTPHSKAQRVSARMSPDGETTYYSNPFKPLLKQMLTDDYLEVFADGGNRVLRARFMMADLDKAIAKHRQQCGLQ